MSRDIINETLADIVNDNNIRKEIKAARIEVLMGFGADVDALGNIDPDLYSALRSKNKKRIAECLPTNEVDIEFEEKEKVASELNKQIFDIIIDENMPEYIKCAKVDLLIKIGADVNAMFGAKSSLRLAKDNNLEKVAELLQNSGAKDVFDEKIANEISQKLIKACGDEEKKDVKEIKELIYMGGNVDARDDDSWFPLLRATYRGKKDVVEFLIQKGADVNQKNNEDLSALIIASMENHREIAVLLVENGAEVYPKNTIGKCALKYTKDEDTKQAIKQALKERNKKEGNAFWGRVKQGLGMEN